MCIQVRLHCPACPQLVGEDWHQCEDFRTGQFQQPCQAWQVIDATLYRDRWPDYNCPDPGCRMSEAFLRNEQVEIQTMIDNQELGVLPPSIFPPAPLTILPVPAAPLPTAPLAAPPIALAALPGAAAPLGAAATPDNARRTRNRWLPEEVETVRRMRTDGASFREIAERLGTHDRHTVSDKWYQIRGPDDKSRRR